MALGRTAAERHTTTLSPVPRATRVAAAADTETGATNRCGAKKTESGVAIIRGPGSRHVIVSA
jgi:hypothetical protein